MATSFTGDRALDRRLASLEKREAKKFARKAINAALTIANKSIKSEAPSKRVRKSIGKRFKKNKRTNVTEAKAGINVGKKRGANTRAPHAHLVALGTRRRKRRRLGGWAKGRSGKLRTGRMRAVDGRFVKRGMRSASGRMQQAIRNKVASELKKVTPLNGT